MLWTVAWLAGIVALIAGIRRAGRVSAFADLGIPFRVSRFHLSVHPEPSPEQAVAMTYRDAAWYASGGVIANLTLGGTLLAVWFFFAGSLGWMTLAGGCAIAAWAGRRWLALILAPAAVLIVAAAVVGVLILPPAGGARVLLPGSLLPAVHAAGIVSVAFALFMLLPFRVLDGGQMLTATVLACRNRSVAAVYERASSWMLAGVVGALMLMVAVRLIGR